MNWSRLTPTSIPHPAVVLMEPQVEGAGGTEELGVKE